MLDARRSTTERTPWAVPFRAANPHKIPIDPNGNLTSKTEGTDNWVYTWNAENQLTRVEKNGAEVARYKYDPVGRRIEKVAAGLSTSYTYDAEDIVREVRGENVVKYTHGPGADDPLGMEVAAQMSFFHADGLDTIVKVTNVLGAVIESRGFDLWGRPDSTAHVAPYLFTGREWDSETYVYHYRARYYDPDTGRFLTQDPIGLLGQDMNLYAYVWNDPINWSDPSGLKGRKPTARSMAAKKLRDMMRNAATQRYEQCFSVCQKPGGDPYTTDITPGTAESCPPVFCPAGADLKILCHVHPAVGGYQGHSPRWTGGQDFYWPDKLRVPSMVGQGGKVWEYDPYTQKETPVEE